MFCLNKNIVNDFLKKLKNGEIDPEKLAQMTSQERRDFFAPIMGEENARQANRLFESKLLLKNQQQGMINWAKQLAGLKPEAQRDIISRINKMEEVLTPENEKAFLEDLAAHKLGISVTMGEAAHISEMAKTVSEKKALIDEKSAIASPDRMEYGRALVDFGDYVSHLKNEAKKLTFADFVANPIKTASKGVSNLAGLAKSLKATLDNSVIGRQGLKVAFSHPEIWFKNSAESFKDMVKVFGGQEVMHEVRADVLSRPNALNGLYKKEGLAIGTVEEAFPTTLPEKIPGVGRVFKASETAFTAFQYRTRADIFDKYIEIADKSGADNIEGIGKLSNSLTGRGTLQKFGLTEKSGTTVNNLFFSPRFVSSNIDLLIAHGLDSKISPFARKQAVINLIKVAVGISTILTIAKAANDESVETDPRSANFGKIKVGDTRFDVTGGLSALATLASRIGPIFIGQKAYTKNSITGKVKEINSGKFGSPTGADVFYNFFEGKLSPAASLIKDLIKGKDFQGNKPTFLNEANNLLTPLPITNYQELQNDPNSANILVAMMADALGIGTNTYGKKKR